MKSQLKKFGMLVVGVVLSLVAISFLPENIKSKIPGVRSLM